MPLAWLWEDQKDPTFDQARMSGHTWTHMPMCMSASGRSSTRASSPMTLAVCTHVYAHVYAHAYTRVYTCLYPSMKAGSTGPCTHVYTRMPMHWVCRGLRSCLCSGLDAFLNAWLRTAARTAGNMHSLVNTPAHMSMLYVSAVTILFYSRTKSTRRKVRPTSTSAVFFLLLGPYPRRTPEDLDRVQRPAES